MIRPITVTLGLVAAALSTVVAAGGNWVPEEAAFTPDPAHGQILYLKHCATCHGRHAWGNGPREIPALAGQRESYLIRQLELFVDDKRQGYEMHGPIMHEALQPTDVARSQAFRDLAIYLSRAARNPHPEYGAGRALALGQRDYIRGCSGCHGSEGGGSDAAAVPAIGGQDYNYLLTQLRSFSAGRLRHPALADSPVALSADEHEAVADYVSRLTYLTASSTR